MLTNEQFTCIAQSYIDTVYRVALNYLRSPADAEDVTQNVFLKLLKESKPFDSEAHIRNWLIRVAINECKNLVASRWWRSTSIEDCRAELVFDNPTHSELFYAVMELPKKYRLPIYLHYYEQYTTEEIGQILKLPKNTVCSHLRRGRELLRKTLQEANDHESEE